MKRFFCLLTLLALSFAQTAQEVALRVENALRSYQSFQANFEQFYYSATISTPLHEKGKLYFKKPNLMKWEYQDPEEKVFLIKDDLFWDYNKEEKQLIKYDLSQGEQNTEVISLLSGKVALLDNYSVEFNPFPTENANTIQIKLTPKDEEFADTFLLLEVDEKTWFIQTLISFDWTGNRTEFRFSKIKTNVTLQNKTFELRVPPDVEIIENN
ncbi:MAG: outer membrane lipoprotein carrier protein LolA [Candidatus Aminicenantes bacterium]|jgi:chaperone LolA|nr:outer membrane lipoprotein carrier protein LolA [Candidatus Aminicenantes bacterium]